jgi:hypothetical protein
MESNDTENKTEGQNKNDDRVDFESGRIIGIQFCNPSRLAV